MSPAIFVLLLMLAMIIAFISGKFNFAVIALCIPVVLQATRILDASQAWSGFSNTGVLLFVPLFILGAVLKKSSFMFHLRRLIRKLAETRGADVKILAVFGIISILLCNFMNATAGIALMAPMITAVAGDAKMSRRGLAKWTTDLSCGCRQMLPFGMVLAVYATNNALLEAGGATERFNLMDPVLARTPFIIVWAVFMVLFGYKLFYTKWRGEDPVELATTSAAVEAEDGRGTTLSPGKDTLAYIMFFGSVAAMLFGPMFTSVPILVWAFGFALASIFMGLVTPKEALDGQVWISILLTAGTIPLTTAISVTGAQEYIASAVRFVTGGQTNIYVLTAIFFLFPMITTQFMNDIASSQIYYAIGIAASVGLGVDPRPIMMAIGIGALTSMWTPMANSGQALNFGSGGYNVIDYFKASFVPSLVFFALYMLYQPIFINFVLK